MEFNEQIIGAIRTVSPEKRREILVYAEKLHGEAQKLNPRLSGKGLWTDLNITLTAAELDENQREMWKSFPRDDF